jgi:hypothetical protein
MESLLAFMGKEKIMCNKYSSDKSREIQALYFGNGHVGSVYILSDYPGETLDGLKLSLGHEEAMYMCHEMYESLDDYNTDNDTCFNSIAELAAANAVDHSQEFNPSINGAEASAIETVRRRLFRIDGEVRP